jgi:hypothetical protein
MKNLELFKLGKLENVGLYYFKLGEVSFLLDEFYKNEILPQTKIEDDEDAYIFLFKETIAKKLTDYAYYLKPDFFFDTIVVKRKRNLSLKEINCWFSVVGYKFGKTYDIGFSDIFSNTEEGLGVYVFRNDRDIAVQKTMRGGSSKLLRFY